MRLVLRCGVPHFFFFCVRCDDRAKSSGRWLLGSPLSAVVRQLAPRAWCPLQCLLAKTVGVLSPGVGRSEECAQEFAPQSHIHSGLNQQEFHTISMPCLKEISCHTLSKHRLVDNTRRLEITVPVGWELNTNN